MADGPSPRNRRLAGLFDCEGAFSEGGAGNVELTGITADSRAVRPGMLFAALPGTRLDGTAFIDDAVSAGAAAVLAGRHYDGDPGVPVFRANDPHAALARAAARFYGRQPQTVVGVTGTNGKTSVTVFLRQIWARAKFSAASLGTIGLVTADRTVVGNLTTPDPVRLHAIFAGLADEGVTHLALEASSHGLEQRRLDGVTFAAAAFTNLSRDHLDYHADLDAYFAAKLRLFDTLMPAGGVAVVDADEAESERVAAVAAGRGMTLFTVGETGETLRLTSFTRTTSGARLVVEVAGERRRVGLPLVGRFQIANALIAAALAMATGVPAAAALEALEHLKGASGRLELAGTHRNGAPIYVDYAHTPDALANALQALRPHTRGRLAVVFGAGGDRDPGKRPLMGEAAATNADLVIVTDDNPRHEDPSAIRASIMTGAPRAREIEGRRAAIRFAIGQLGKDDLLLIAGKGHETGQTIGDVVHPFSDQEEVRAALAGAESAA